MWPVIWSKIENESPELLAKCRGLRAQVCEYQISHGQLLIRFYRDGTYGGIYLYCKSCDRVEFNAFWQDADISVEISEGEFGPIYTITDGERLRIECHAAFLGEYPDSLTIPRPGDFV